MMAPVLILGATGIVGRGLVAAAVEAGRPLIAVARDRAELQRLHASHSDAGITVLAGSVGSDADAAALAQALRALDRPLAGVVVAVSGVSGRGRLLDQPVATLQHQLDQDLLPHLAAARHLLPLLAEADRGGTYVLIGGPGSDLPWSGYGHRSVAAAAQRMLACVLHDEARALSVRVQLLAVDAPVCNDLSRAQACPKWPSAIDIGRHALELIERGPNTEPTCAIVPYSKSRPHPTHASTAAMASPTVTHADRDDSGRAASALPSRCLQDARRLLRTLSSPHAAR